MCDITTLKLAKENNKQAKEEIILKYTPIIKKQLKKYSLIDSYDIEDLMQHGILSILKAIDKFDINKSSSFTSYVNWTILNNFAYLCRQKNYIKKPVSLNVKNKEGDELINIIVDKFDIEEDVLSSCDEEILKEIPKTLDEDELNLFNFLMYSGVKCPLKRFSEKYNIEYSTCVYQKKKLKDKLKYILKEF